MNLEMLPQAGGVGVGLVAAANSTSVGLVRCVDMHVLLTIAGVGKSPVASLHLAFKRLLTWEI